MHTGGRLLGNAFPVGHDVVPETGPFLCHALQQILDDGNFVVVAR